MEFIIYLLKVNIAIVLFYGIYRLLFQQDTFFQWKRLALLMIIFISLLYPAIDLTRQIIASHQLKNILETVYIPVYNLPEFVVTANANTSIHFFPQIVFAIYILISCLLLIRILFQIGAIMYKLHRTTKKVLFGQTVYESAGLKTPFSFFNRIVLDSSLYSADELQEILLHETTHVKQGHSADTLLAEFLCIFCWFNPFAWLLKTEIRMNLEFLADRSVLSSGCGAEHYQFHLLRLSYHKAAAKITNNFNVSLLKKRIFMMNKKQTPHRSIWKYALILPIVAVLLFFNSTFRAKAETENKTDIVQMNNDLNIIQPDNEMNAELQNPVKAQNKPAKSQSKPVIVEDKLASNNLEEITVTAYAPQDKPENSKEIFSHVEDMPKFPGGEAALFKWLAENINYPTLAAEQGIQGRVNVSFIVRSDGSIEDVEVQKGVDPLCDKEAVRVIKMMPKWIPGKQNGKPVNVYFQLPILFKLSKDESAKPATKPAQSNTIISDLNILLNDSDVVIEVDGKVMSKEELKQIDSKTVVEMNVNKKVKPYRISITTEKE